MSPSDDRRPPVLDDTNYTRWIRAMESHLKKTKTWRCVTGEDEEDLQEFLNSLSATNQHLGAEKRGEIRDNRLKATAIIWDYLSESWRFAVQDLQDPKEVWQMIKQKVQTEGSLNVASLEAIITNEYYADGDNWSKFLQRKVNAFNELSKTESPRTEHSFVTTIALALPDEYEYVMMETTRKKKATIEEFNTLMSLCVKNRRIRANARRLPQRTRTHLDRNRQPQLAALSTSRKRTRDSSTTSRREGSQPKQRKKPCSFCAKVGLMRTKHSESKCYLNPKYELFRGDEWAQELLRRQRVNQKYRDQKPTGSANLAETKPMVPSPGLSTFDVDFRVDEYQ